MTTSDIDQALRVLNIEPLYGHSAHNPPTFRRALPFPQLPTAGPVYFIEDEEIDFDRVLREDKITLPKGVSWTAHWLAVEGVQPLIPENPPAIPREPEQDVSKSPQTILGFPPTPPSPSRAANKKQQQQQQLVKQVLSRELQLYYTRLTSSLLPPSSSDQAKRTAALASLRSDAGLQALLPYLIRWIGEGVVSALKEGAQSENDGKVLEVLMDVISAIMDNTTLFVEPYVSSFCFSKCAVSDHPTVATSNSSSNTIYAFALISTSISRNLPAYFSISDSLAVTNSTFNHISFTVPSHHEDSPISSHFPSKEQGYARRRDTRTCRCRERGC